MLCGEDEALLLVRVDAGGCAAEIAAAALAYLGEYQGFSIAQDQVDFPETAAVIGSEPVSGRAVAEIVLQVVRPERRASLARLACPPALPIPGA